MLLRIILITDQGSVKVSCHVKCMYTFHIQSKIRSAYVSELNDSYEFLGNFILFTNPRRNYNKFNYVQLPHRFVVVIFAKKDQHTTIPLFSVCITHCL